MCKLLKIMLISGGLLSGLVACANNTSLTTPDKSTVEAPASIDDSSIQSKLSAKYSNSDNFPNSNIYVDVFNRTALLTGQVKDQAQKDFAENIARGYPGVVKIYDYVDVRLPSSFSARSKDSMITAQLKTQLFGEPGVPSGGVKVVTTNAVVYMLGVVNQDQAESATRIAASVGGVDKVVTLFEYLN